jgi:hypothetical protein
MTDVMDNGALRPAREGEPGYVGPAPAAPVPLTGGRYLRKSLLMRRMTADEILELEALLASPQLTALRAVWNAATMLSVQDEALLAAPVLLQWHPARVAELLASPSEIERASGWA